LRLWSIEGFMRQLLLPILLLLPMAGLAYGADPGPRPETMPRLPEGHPAIAGHAATTKPASAKGRLTIRAVQGTANAPIPANDAVMAHFHGSGGHVAKSEVHLDAQGAATIDNIALTPDPVEPVIVVQHGDMQYQVVASAMDSAHTQQEVEVPVYEVAEQVPAWRIQMRHVIIQPEDDQVRVRVMVAVENPGDRTWVGVPDEHGARSTVMLLLPAGLQDLELGDGFAEDSAHFDGKLLTACSALVPGVSRYQFSYVLPIRDGKVSIAVKSPVATRHLMVVVPDDGSEVRCEGLQARGSMEMGEGKTRLFQTMELPPDQAASVTISGLAFSAAASVAGGGSSLPQILAIGGLGVVVLAGAAILLKPGHQGKPKAERQEGR
jgi:hypothetical protein